MPTDFTPEAVKDAKSKHESLNNDLQALISDITGLQTALATANTNLGKAKTKKEKIPLEAAVKKAESDLRAKEAERDKKQAEVNAAQSDLNKKRATAGNAMCDNILSDVRTKGTWEWHKNKFTLAGDPGLPIMYFKKDITYLDNAYTIVAHIHGKTGMGPISKGISSSGTFVYDDTNGSDAPFDKVEVFNAVELHPEGKHSGKQYLYGKEAPPAGKTVELPEDSLCNKVKFAKNAIKNAIPSAKFTGHTDHSQWPKPEPKAYPAHVGYGGVFTDDGFGRGIAESVYALYHVQFSQKRVIGCFARS